MGNGGCTPRMAVVYFPGPQRGFLCPRDIPNIASDPVNTWLLATYFIGGVQSQVEPWLFFRVERFDDIVPRRGLS